MNPQPIDLPGADAAEPCAEAAQAGMDRRCQADRRQRPTDPWQAFLLGGRRQTHRRGEDRHHPYFVDRFSLAMLLGILALVSASFIDAALTVQLLLAGGKEINPLMDGLLAHGLGAFIMGKYALTVAGLPLLLIFKNHRLFGTSFRVGYLIPLFVALYCVLIAYQLALLHGGLRV
jgi:hypothetical protein